MAPTDQLHVPIIVQGPTKMRAITPASIVPDDREVAWAGDRSRINIRPDRGYLMGRYLGMGPKNTNGHIFIRSQVEPRLKDIVDSPLNVMHQAPNIIGHFVDSTIVDPSATDVVGPDPSKDPYVDTAALVQKYARPNDWLACQGAHGMGALYFSMECVPDEVICPDCDAKATYAGPASPATYCDHMNVPGGGKILHNPLFVGGAVVLPPGRPGWSNANVTEVASLLDTYSEEAAEVYDQLMATSDHLPYKVAEQLTASMLAGVVDLAAVPTWESMTRGYTTIDFTPPPAVASAAAKAISAADDIQTELARAAILARGDRRPPATIHRMAALTTNDLGYAFAGGSEGVGWARTTLAAMHTADLAATAAMIDAEAGTDAAMIALMPAAADATKLAVAGIGLPASQLHVTLRYLGKTSTLPPDAIQAAGAAARGAAGCLDGPIEAIIAGCGTLGPGGAVVLFLNTDLSRAASEVRWSLDSFERMKAREARTKSSDPTDPYFLDPDDEPPAIFAEAPANWIAHLTIGYTTDEDTRNKLIAAGEALNGTSIILDRVALWVNGTATEIPLTVPGVDPEAQEIPVPVGGPVDDILAADDELVLAWAVELGIHASDISQADRNAAAKSGAAMSDGSYPIRNAKELKAAIKLVGRSKKFTYAQVKAHIMSRAKALGLTGQLPPDWTSSTSGS